MSNFTGLVGQPTSNIIPDQIKNTAENVVSSIGTNVTSGSQKTLAYMYENPVDFAFIVVIVIVGFLCIIMFGHAAVKSSTNYGSSSNPSSCVPVADLESILSKYEQKNSSSNKKSKSSSPSSNYNSNSSPSIANILSSISPMSKIATAAKNSMNGYGSSSTSSPSTASTNTSALGSASGPGITLGSATGLMHPSPEEGIMAEENTTSKQYYNKFDEIKLPSSTTPYISRDDVCFREKTKDKNYVSQRDGCMACKVDTSSQWKQRNYSSTGTNIVKSCAYSSNPTKGLWGKQRCIDECSKVDDIKL